MRMPQVQILHFSSFVPKINSKLLFSVIANNWFPVTNLKATFHKKYILLVPESRTLFEAITLRFNGHAPCSNLGEAYAGDNMK